MYNQIEKLIISTNDIERRYILKNLPLNIQQMFLESAIIANKKQIQVNKNFRDFILSYFKEFINEIDGITVSTLGDTMKCLSSNYEWNDCSDDVKEYMLRAKSEIEEKLLNNEYGYYGIYIKSSNKFLIRDVSNKEIVEAEDTREKTRGKACKSWKRNELLKVALKLKLDVNDLQLKKMKKQQLISYANGGKIKKKLEKIFDLSTLDEYSEDDIRRIIHYGQMPVKGLCQNIYNFFEMNELLVIN